VTITNKCGEIMDLSSMSLTELRRQQARIEKEIRVRSNVARKDLLKKMQKMAAEEGLSLSDIVAGAQAALAISVTAILSAITVTILLGSITFQNFLTSIENITAKYWPVVIIAAGLLVLLSLEHKRK
jgi:hypothetical protein